MPRYILLDPHRREVSLSKYLRTKMKKLICLTLIGSFLLSSVPARGEALDDRFTEVAPGSLKGSSEFTHGAGHGKLLMRLLILGAVPQQGVHYVPEGTDLLFAILYAGGYNDETKLSSVTVRRRSMKQLMEVDLEGLIEDGKDIPKLYDGDIINVPFNWRRDIATISLITGFITSMTGFTLAIIALAK